MDDQSGTVTNLEMIMGDRQSLDGLTAQIVSAYVSNNQVTRTDLPHLILEVRAALAMPLASSTKEETGNIEKPTPAQIKKSITDDALISFEDGKSYKTLKRHLRNVGLEPQAYRAKWGLPYDYPMTSPAYSRQRSELAKALGLGQQQRAAAKAAPSDPKVSDTPRRRKPTATAV